MTAESGASILIDGLVNANTSDALIADAGGAITLAATATPSVVSLPIQILGASGQTAGGVVTIQSGYTVTGQISLGAGATLNLQNQSVAPTVVGSSGVVNLNASSVSVSGGADVINFQNPTNQTMTLSQTNGAWDAVYGSGGTVLLNAAQLSVVGASDTIDASTGSWVSFYGGSASLGANANTMVGSSDNVIVNGGAATVNGQLDSITAVQNAVTTVQNNGLGWDVVFAAGEQVNVKNSALLMAQVSVSGSANSVSLGNSWVSLWNTNGIADSVSDVGGNVILNNAQAYVYGAGADTIVESGVSTVRIDNTSGYWYVVNATSGTVNLTNANGVALASVMGGGNAISAAAGSSASLYSTNGVADTLTGSSFTTILNSAQASVTGSNDVISLTGVNTLSVTGSSETFQFGLLLGASTISGFNASDKIKLNAMDWSSFSSLQSSGAMYQSGQDTVITQLGLTSIRLAGVQESSLTAANFTFS